VAADYADAMLVARRWKNLFFLLLFLGLVIQIGVFFFLRYYGAGTVTITAGSTTQPAATSTHNVTVGLAWLTNFVGFVSMICVVSLAVVLLLIVGIMLVGRLVGVAHVTSAFVWCVVLAALLFPWQSLWNYPIADTVQTAPETVEHLEVGPHYGLPGVLYTWPELEHRAHFTKEFNRAAYLGWARFVIWPIAALIILGSVQVRSTRGLRFALGEAEIQVPTTPTVPPAGTV
jgi:hypothetical protein